MSNWSNRLAPVPPSRERADEMIAGLRVRLREQVLQPHQPATPISVEMFDRGKREGWIVERNGVWTLVSDWVLVPP
jgi:hypothetical protein